MTKQETLVGNAPTRRTVEQLFKNLYRLVNAYENEEIRAAGIARDEREKDILQADQVLKRLNRQYERLREKFFNVREKNKHEIARVQRMYQVRGLTPAVRKKISDLVDKFEKE